MLYEGTGNASLQFRIDARGELIIRIEFDRDIEIKSFTLH